MYFAQLVADANELYPSMMDAPSVRPNIRKIYYEHVVNLQYAPSMRTFQQWVTFGHKYLVLSASASVYILVLIAGLDLRWKFARQGARVVWEVAKMLREPETSSKSFFAFEAQAESSRWANCFLNRAASAGVNN